nr:MAG TPA: minor tail protein [Caudoviricetes sp.]
MGAEIDRLEIEVEAQATKANNALDKLVGKLERLAGSLGNIDGNVLTGLSKGIDSLSNSMQGMKNVGTADFTRLAKNISQIGSVDTSGINKTANAINRISSSLGQPESVINGAAAIGKLAKGISKLGNKSVITAIDNMPKLATALNSMMNTLSKAPTVSSNLINMTTALAGLANQGSKVGSTTRSMTSSLNGYSASAQRASKSSKGLASVFGSLYANFFWVKRGVDKLWKSIETSMDYVETLNYFDAAFGQVAESAVSQWEDAGAESAEAYYKSFSDRAKQLTSKMTGFSVKDDGTLQATGQPSLGIDPEKLMNYQATFGQMASSMGVTAETSLKLSQALTEIGGDLASVKNLDFDKVWNDMASGLAGMSRTLDKYGVNIRNVNLQQKLNELGIQANITALNQNDKALLRAIILLDSTKYAWGDLATTINQPANQLRLIESNFQNLSRTIGNLFLPMVSKVLPYVNAMVIALQRLATWLGNLLGIDLSKVTSSVAESSFDFGSIADEAEAATEAVNKLQKGIRKFDELDVITTSSGSSSGSGGGLDSGLLDDAFSKSFEEYQKAWDEAFANMENKAQDLADKIEKFFAPVKKIFQDLFDGDFFAAGRDTSKLVAGIFNWFADAIAAVDWYKIGHNIGEFLDGIEWGEVFLAAGNFLETAIDAAIDLWKGSFDADPIATVIVTALGIAHFTGLDKKLKDKIVEAIPTTLGSKSLTVVIGAITWVIGFNVGKSLGKALFPDDKEYYDNFTWFGDGGFFDTIVNTDIPTLLDAWDNLNKDITDNDLYRILTGTFFLTKHSTIDDFIDKVKGIPDAFNSVKTVVSDWFMNDVVPWTTKEKWEELGENMKSSLNKKWDEFETNWKSTGVYQWFTNDVSPWLSREKWESLGDNAKNSLSEKWDEFKDYWKNTGAYNWYTNDVAPWLSREKWNVLGENAKKSLSEKWSAFTDWWKNTGFAKWWDDVSAHFTKKAWTWDGIESGLSQAWNNAITSIKNIWNRFAEWLNDKLNFSWDGIPGVLESGSISLGKIPTFETGGYVPNRFSMFMAGENGVPEIVGTVGGKTAVAGGVEITGIKDAVFATAQQEIELLRRQNEILLQLLSKPTISNDDVFSAAKAGYKSEARRLGAQGNPQIVWG